MYLKDRDALVYASRLILLFVPYFSSMFGVWSWLIELLLIFALLINGKYSGALWTTGLLAVGYVMAFFPVGVSGLVQIGYVPWAAVLLLWLQEKGLSVSKSIFWALVLAALLSALPTAGTLSEALQPEVMQEKISSAMEYYEKHGYLQALEQQGMTRANLESYMQLVLPLYYKLMPGLAGLIGMIEISLAYLVFRLIFKNRESRLLPFARWQLPWYGVWGAIIGLAAYLLGDYAKISPLTITGMNIMVIFAGISLVLGLACLVYLVQSPKTQRWQIWLIIIGGVFFTQVALIALIFVGLFDLVFNFRRLPEKNEEGKL